jgi:hypothetical protein
VSTYIILVLKRLFNVRIRIFSTATFAIYTLAELAAVDYAPAEIAEFCLAR